MRNYGKSVFDLDANIVAMLCYLLNLVCALGLVLSIITVVLEKSNKLARFHAWQSIFLWVTGFLFSIAYSFIGFLIGLGVSKASGSLSSLVGLVLWLVSLGISLAIFVFMIIAAIKAYNGEIYKIPLIGEYADRLSS
jgi:uncharacterized membrane protein